MVFWSNHTQDRGLILTVASGARQSLSNVFPSLSTSLVTPMHLLYSTFVCCLLAAEGHLTDGLPAALQLTKGLLAVMSGCLQRM